MIIEIITILLIKKIMKIVCALVLKCIIIIVFITRQHKLNQSIIFQSCKFQSPKSLSCMLQNEIKKITLE